MKLSKLFVIALLAGTLGVFGCSDDPETGSGGAGGTGGMPECQAPVDCEDDGDECTAARCTDGSCQTKPLADGAACTGGECRQGTCTSVFPCDEQGILDAIAEGGGPHFFACNGPTTVVTTAVIVINNDVILDGEGDLTVDGNLAHGVFFVPADKVVELRGVTVSGGRAERGNVGGGIHNQGTLTLTNSTVSGNTTESFGGGILNEGRGFAQGTLTLTNSTVSGNTAVGAYAAGGGITNFGTLTLINSTVSGNTAPSGGGIVNLGTLTLTNSTVSGNTTSFGVGGGILNDRTMTLTNSLIDGDCFSGVTTTTTSGGGNLESPGNNCGFDQPTDQVNVSADDLKLGPLEDNGGPTQTHALLSGSVAIDVIPTDVCEVDEDQRGEPRPGGSMCDVGAFEVQP